MTARSWTAPEVAALPVVIDLPTAGAVLGMSRGQAYELHRRGEFPVPVLQMGSRYRVVTARVRELLGVEPDTADTRRASLPEAG